MKLIIVANEQMNEEFLSNDMYDDVQIFSIPKIRDLENHTDADAVIDLLFSNVSSELVLLNGFLPKPVIINSVLNTLNEINPGFIRINGWPSFLNREIVECSGNNEENKKSVEKIFSYLGKKATWVPDIAGFITPRIISQIINEAYLALEEEVSTKQEIDTAMKLGTNYPYGPFEWSEKIGLKNILDLLNKLSEKESRYNPAPLIIKEAEANK
jgi:3-hydroxybutyryl-CoA dehydrogenase